MEANELENQEQKQEQPQVKQEQLQEVLAAVELLKQQNQQLQSRLEQSQSKQEQKQTEEDSEEVEQSMRDILGMEKPNERIAKKGIDELSNTELVEALSMATEQLVNNARNTATKEVASTIQSVNKRIEAIQGVVMNLAVQSDIKACRDKYQDFDAHSKDIQAELQSTPGLSIEKAYLLVKASKASRIPSKRSTETEMPSDALTEASDYSEEQEQENEPVSRKAQATKQRSTYTSPSASFRDALSEAVNKVVSARQRSRGVQ